VVAYLVDGRLKLPKGTPTFEIGDEEMTSPPDLPSDSRKVLPVPTPEATPASSLPAHQP
jgi:hypothetical protein